MKKSKRNKKIRLTLDVKVIEQDLSYEQHVDSIAMSIMDMLEDRISPQLLDLLKEMLLGFSGDMQLEIADDLLDFVQGHSIHTTGCPSADSVLMACYMWIADEKGFKLNLLNIFNL